MIEKFIIVGNAQNSVGYPIFLVRESLQDSDYIVL